MADTDPSLHDDDRCWPSWGNTPGDAHVLLGGRYLLQDEIGAGASSITYRGRDERLGRRVAIKVLRSQYAVNPGLIRRFQREARAAASVSHPHVVHVHDVGHHDDRLYIVMEYIDGENLKERLARAGPLPPLEAMRIVRQVLAGLAAIHRAGIIHRDIKPHNILIGADGVARVVDFGIVHLIAETGLTTEGTTLGTAAYMAPEQAQGGSLVRATDLYAVGVVLYELVTGRVPFEAPSSVAAIYAHIHAQPVPPSHRAPGLGIPPVLDQLILRAMAKRPQDRFVDAEEMRRALGVAVQHIPRREPVSPRRRHAYGVFALFLVCLLVAGAVGTWLLNRDPTGTGRGPESTVQQVAAALTESETAPGAPGESNEPILFSVGPTKAAPTDTAVPTPTVTLAPTQTPGPTSTSDPTETPRPTDTPVPTEAPGPPPASDRQVPIAAIGAESEGSGDEGTATEDLVIIDDQGESQSIERLQADSGSTDSPEEDAGVESIQRSFTAGDWEGAYFQETGNLQPWAALYAQSTGYGQGSLTFSLEGAPASDTFVLTVEGMTSENWAAVPITILVNGQQAYTGASPFSTWDGVEGQQPWTSATFELPAQLLQIGENTVTVVNTVAEGSFSLPPYVLVADATVTVDVPRSGE